MAEENKPAKTLAPGTIDQVRKNIGPIDPEEAKLMSQKLGGEVLRERAAVQEPISRPSPKRTSQGASSVRASGYSSSDVAERSKNTMTDSHKSSSGTNTAEKKKKPVEDLPEVSAKDLKLMEKLMMSSEYDIKPDYGLFTRR